MNILLMDGLPEDYKGIPISPDSVSYTHLDVYKRQVLTGVSQTVGKLQMQRAQEMGQDLMELTAHAGARPTHAVWQGKLVSLSGRPGYLSLTDIGYGDPAGFKGVNCGHDWYPYFEGLSEPAYTPEQLRQYNDRTVKYDGKEMDLYDATQHQRYIERQIRRWKRESSALDAAGLDNSYARGDVYKRQGYTSPAIRAKIATPIRPAARPAAPFCTMTINSCSAITLRTPAAVSWSTLLTWCGCIFTAA